MSATTLCPPSRAIQRQGFQLRQSGFAVAEESALRVVHASLHKGQQGASHNALGGQTQHVAKIPRSALEHSQYQVVHRHRCRCSVVLTGDDMKTATVKTVDHAHHRSCEDPGLTRVCELTHLAAIHHFRKMFLCSAVSSQSERSICFTLLHPLGRSVDSDTNSTSLGSILPITAQRIFTGASWIEQKCQSFEMGIRSQAFSIESLADYR